MPHLEKLEIEVKTLRRFCLLILVIQFVMVVLFSLSFSADFSFTNLSEDSTSMIGFFGVVAVYVVSQRL